MIQSGSSRMLKKSASGVPRLAGAASRGRSHHFETGEAYLVKPASPTQRGEREAKINRRNPGYSGLAGERRVLARWGGRVRMTAFLSILG